jgi:DNA helicase II / ATP-dependent DNA helicase PcrA
VLTRAMARTLYGGTHFNQPSPFLAELPDNVCSHVQGDRLDLSRLVGQKPQAPPQREAPALAGTSRQTQAQHGQPDLSHYLGHRVRHPILGEGVVMSLSGHGKTRCLLIQVDDGTVHQILERYANLEIIGDA